MLKFCQLNLKRCDIVTFIAENETHVEGQFLPSPGEHGDDGAPVSVTAEAGHDHVLDTRHNIHHNTVLS